MTDLSEKESSIVLEVSPFVDLDDHLGLRYNLGALSSGIGTETMFRVMLDEKDCTAQVYALSGGDMSIIIFGDGIRQFVAQTVDEAIMILVNGDDMPIEMEAGYEFHQEIDSNIDSMFVIVDELDRNLDRYSAMCYVERLKDLQTALDDLIDEIDY